MLFKRLIKSSRGATNSVSDRHCNTLDVIAMNMFGFYAGAEI